MPYARPINRGLFQIETTDPVIGFKGFGHQIIEDPALFFWVTVRQPAPGFIAVFPIVLVLISVLGTMALLEIPYKLITSIITALSIGSGSISC